MKVSCCNSFLLLATVSLAAFEVVTAADDDCFTTSLAIVEAQVTGARDFVICPNTTIEIGVPTDAAYTDFVDGDIPLTVVADDVTIKCGEDGKSSNNCVLNGGLIQFVTSAVLTQAPGLILTSNNLMVQGLTFKGILTTFPGVESVPVTLASPGKNIVFDDIIFESVRANMMFLLGPTTNSPTDSFPPGASHVTLKNSVFRNVAYGDVVVENIDQSLILDGVVFENVMHDIRLTTGNKTASNIIHASGVELQVLNTEFTNVEFGTTVVYVEGETTNYTIDGVTGSSWVVTEGGPTQDAADVCADGLIVATSDSMCMSLAEGATSAGEISDSDSDSDSGARLLSIGRATASTVFSLALFVGYL